MFNLNWSLLARTVFVYLAITALCIAAVGVLAVRFSSDHILGQVSVSSQHALESKKAILDERISKVDNIIYQTMYDENTFRLVWSGDAGTSSLLTMRDVIRDFQSIVRSHAWIDSLYFYDSRHDYVLSDTKTSKADFGDQPILRAAGRDELAILGPRLLGDQVVLTFARSFPFFTRQLTGYVVVNVDYRSFFGMLGSRDENSRYVVVDHQGQTIYPPDEQPLHGSATAVLAANPRGATVVLDGTQFSIVHGRSEALDWTVVYLQDYESVVSSAALVSRLILVSVAGVLVLSGLLVWLTTRRLQQPLSAIVRRARGLIGASANERDEYEIVEAAIRQLLANNLELSERYRTALPYFRKYSLEEFLHTESWDNDRFSAILSVLGVHLRRSYLHVGIAESRDSADGSTLRRSIERYLQSHDETLAFVAAETHDSRVTLIINTDSDAQTVFVVLSGLQNALADESLSVSIALSTQFEEVSEIPHHFAEAEEQLQHRAFFGDDQVLYDFKRNAAATREVSPTLPTEPVLEAVRAQDQEAATNALLAFCRVSEELADGDPTYARFAFFELATAIDGVLPDSTRTEDRIERRARLFKAVHESERTEELQARVADMIAGTVRDLHRVKSEHHEELVRRSIDYLEKHLGESVSVDDVAEAVFISGRYLNQIFKTHTGNTVFEHLSLMRVHRAEELLHDPSLQIQEVAARVGYENVQSFTRLFKRHHGMTPVEYRRAAGRSA